MVPIKRDLEVIPLLTCKRRKEQKRARNTRPWLGIRSNRVQQVFVSAIWFFKHDFQLVFALTPAFLNSYYILTF